LVVILLVNGLKSLHCSVSPASAPPLPRAEERHSAEVGSLTFTLEAAARPAPRRIAVDRQGYVYVADEAGHVRRFSPTGAYVAQFERADAAPFDPTTAPIEGITVDDARRVYVAVGGNLLVFDGPSGVRLTEIDSKPPSTCYRGVVALENGKLLAQTSCSDQGFSLHVMAPTGDALSRRGVESTSWSQDPKIRFAVDGHGNAYVHQRLRGTISVMDEQGKEIREIPFDGGYPSAMVVVSETLVVGAAGEVYLLSVGGTPRGKLPLGAVGAIHDVAAGPDGQVWVVSDDQVSRFKFQ
jgi:outer membrane protein assembly factor BamB